MSKINGEKARAAVTLKKRTARRAKERVLRAEMIANQAAKETPKTVVETVKEKAVKVTKRAGDALAELAEMARPKSKKKSDPPA